MRTLEEKRRRNREYMRDRIAQIKADPVAWEAFKANRRKVEKARRQRDPELREAKRQRSAEWRAKHPDRARKSAREWARRNQEWARRRHAEQMESLEGRTRILIGSARTRAAQKGIPFELTQDCILVTLALGRCQATGLKLDFSPSEYRVNPLAPSLDRFDTKDGYTVNNTRVVCAAFNMARGEWGDDVFGEIAQAFLDRREEAYLPQD